MRSTLLEMLTYARPAGTRTENKFRNRYIRPLGAISDAWGNLHVSVPGADVPILWTCHTDTVHGRQGRQAVQVRNHWAGLTPSRGKGNPWGTCLGADDTVGVYLCIEMIKARVPGDYIFHYGEEHGGIGSGQFAASRPEWLADHQIAIALDRQGTGDIVTHQHAGRTASDAFAESLGRALSSVNPALSYAPAHGTYTDTAEYADIIPECSNLSIGYRAQHSGFEQVDLYYLEQLRAALCQFDASGLVVARDPRVHDIETSITYLDNWDRWDRIDDEETAAYREMYRDVPDGGDGPEHEQLVMSQLWDRYDKYDRYTDVGQTKPQTQRTYDGRDSLPKWLLAHGKAKQ